MKFYEFILKLQELNPGKIVMVSSGVFFNSVGKDAIVLEHLLGFKRTCFAKGLCRVGMPVTYVRENMEEVKKRLKAKNVSVIIYDEIKGGRYKFGNKEYDVLFELEGNDIKEERKCLNCKECDNNIYSKNTNIYTIDRENFEKLNKDTREFIKRLLNIK